MPFDTKSNDSGKKRTLGTIVREQYGAKKEEIKQQALPLEPVKETVPVSNDAFFETEFKASTVPLPPLPSILDATKHAPTMRGRGKEATTATVPLPTDDPATWTIDGRPALAVAADELREKGKGQKAFHVSDPRGDLVSDTVEWTRLLQRAYGVDGDDPHGTYGLLHGLRCLGAALQRKPDRLYLLPGEIDQDEWKSHC